MISLQIIYLLIAISNAATKRVCDPNSETCSEFEIESDELTLGQKLLQKQTEFYHLNQLSYSEQNAAQSIKMYNPNHEAYDFYWFDSHRNKGIYKGKLRPHGMTATNSYIGHVFYFTTLGSNNEIFRFAVTKNVNDYIIPPTDESIKQEPFYVNLKEKQMFYKDYFDQTGIAWLSHYKRPKPILFMYNQDAQDPIGTIYTIKTPHSFWNCIPDDSLTKTEQIVQCQDQKSEGINVNIEVISTKPKMFVIENIISDVECELVKQLATPKLHRSGTGQATDARFNDETRTSKTAWLGHSNHIIIDTIFKRTADILQIDKDVLKKNAESMQTVFYETGQEYKAHHDFGDNGKNIASRFITILFYLTEQIDEYSGGETWFPKARDGKGIKVHPGKGNAVLFYDLLQDGNGDDLTLHEAVKVKNGTKWICNFWVWDPVRNFK